MPTAANLSSKTQSPLPGMPPFADRQNLSQTGSTDQSRMQRVQAWASAVFKRRGGRTHIQDLYQQGSAKIRLPNVHADHAEAILINTAGGLTGGDRLSWSLDVGTGGFATVTTQACEKSYCSNAASASVETRLRVAEDAKLFWLPQETILYEGSSLNRNFSVDLSSNATFIAVESLVLGRSAMGEAIETIHLHDRWRISRTGTLCHAEDIRLSDGARAVPQMQGMNAVASIFYSGPDDPEQLAVRCNDLRQIMLACNEPEKVAAGLSAFNGKITGRILATDSYILRKVLFAVLNELTENTLPRIWRS